MTTFTRGLRYLPVIVMLCASTSTPASETTTYSYDAKGRLVRVVKSGSVNNGVATDYTHDKADNRARVKTSGR